MKCKLLLCSDFSGAELARQTYKCKSALLLKTHFTGLAAFPLHFVPFSYRIWIREYDSTSGYIPLCLAQKKTFLSSYTVLYPYPQQLNCTKSRGEAAKPVNCKSFDLHFECNRLAPVKIALHLRGNTTEQCWVLFSGCRRAFSHFATDVRCTRTSSCVITTPLRLGVTTHS